LICGAAIGADEFSHARMLNGNGIVGLKKILQLI